MIEYLTLFAIAAQTPRAGDIALLVAEEASDAE
jgi:hypothetical protein